MNAGRWAAAWVALVIAGSLLAVAAHGAGTLPGDLVVTEAIQSVPPNSTVGISLTYVGEAVWFLSAAALSVALLRRRWSAALFILLAGVTGFLVGFALELPVASPRPPAEFSREASEGYGFPSTTALLTVVLLGAVCYLVRVAPRPAFVAALAASFFLVLAGSLSRVYVGEHWATDVVGGWLFGGAWLLVLLAIYRWWSSGRVKPRGNPRAGSARP